MSFLAFRSFRKTNKKIQLTKSKTKYISLVKSGAQVCFSIKPRKVYADMGISFR